MGLVRWISSLAGVAGGSAAAPAGACARMRGNIASILADTVDLRGANLHQDVSEEDLAAASATAAGQESGYWVIRLFCVTVTRLSVHSVQLVP
jgi:hypothetical protein